jgi:outer membrane beta-barrel protein
MEARRLVNLGDPHMRAVLKLAAPLLLLLGVGTLAPEANAGAKPAEQALSELKGGKRRYDVVQNRFFLKEGRFEVAPVAGLIPNNPFASRYIGGIHGAYHFSENLAAEGAFIYSPERGLADLKGLTNTLVAIAEEGSGNVSFQQPVDKAVFGATFAARWSPVYGKINLLGERVANFDFYGTAGLGMLTLAKYYARYDDNVPEGEPTTALTRNETKTVVPVTLGVGLNFFVSSSVAFKLDARNYLYWDSQPQYDPDVPNEEGRIYNNFVATTGVSVFFPKMKPRQFDF